MVGRKVQENTGRSRFRRAALSIAAAFVVMVLQTAAFALGPDFVDDFTAPRSDWALSGGFSLRENGLITGGRSGNAVLQGRTYESPTITARVTVDRYGDLGSVRLLWGWQEEWVGYAATFTETGVYIYRFDGNYDRFARLAMTNQFRLKAGRTYEIQVVVRDASFAIYVDGEPVLHATDPLDKYPAGAVGIKASNAIHAAIHHFSVSDAEVMGPVADEKAGVFEEYVAVWEDASAQWAREGHWSLERHGLVHDMAPNTNFGLTDTYLRDRIWHSPTIEAEISVQEFGNLGFLRLMFGWQDRWSGYGVSFGEHQIVLHRFDGSVRQFEILKQVPWGLEAGRTYDVRVAYDAGRIEVFLDGELLFDVEDALVKYPSGFVGFKGSNFIRASVHAYKVSGRVTRPTVKPAAGEWPYSGSEPLITGTFLQLDATTLDWTEAMWRREFEAMREVGIDTLILQWVGNFQRQEVYYPSDVLRVGHRHVGGSDLLQLLLDLAHEYDMDLWIGAYRDGGFAQRLEQDAETNRRVIEEVAARYGDHPAFAGWYVTNEVPLIDAAPVNPAWADHIGRIADYARAATPGKPVGVSPALRVSVWKDTEAAAVYWEEFLCWAKVDVVMVQDGMGLASRSGFTVDDVAAFYQAMQIAARKVGVQFWNDLENFDNRSREPAPIDRVLDQLKATAPYVDKTVIFEFNHYMSPVRAERAARLGSISARAAIAQYEGYKAYLEAYRQAQPE